MATHWIVFQWHEGQVSPTISGVYDSLEKAHKNAPEHATIGGLPFNERLPDEITPWPDDYYSVHGDELTPHTPEEQVEYVEAPWHPEDEE